jgi:hypothetical protein
VSAGIIVVHCVKAPRFGRLRGQPRKRRPTRLQIGDRSENPEDILRRPPQGLPEEAT